MVVGVGRPTTSTLEMVAYKGQIGGGGGGYARKCIAF